MSHRYRSQPIEVVVGVDGVPAGFCWRGRRYVVRTVIATWVESVPWWPRESRAGQGSGQRHAWRVEAVAATGATGVYELYQAPATGNDPRDDPGDDHWALVRVID